ncbi:MAG: sugar phosphate nucleotidyltransferase, partial [Candidatus Omnitrophota bacterium]
MNAIILVAGKEKKLMPYTNQMHQCLFRLADDQTILGNMLEKLVALKKIDRIIIVVGHKKELIFKELKEIKKKICFKNITCVENKDFLTTNVIYSLWLCRKYLLKPFLLLDGDIICEQELLEKLIHPANSRENLLLADFDYKLGQSDNKIKVAHNRIVRIGKRVQLNRDSKFGRSIGIGKFSVGNSMFVKRMSELIRQDKKDLIYEDVLDELLPCYIFRPVATYGYNWMEVDNIEEFKKMNNIFSALDKLKAKALSLGATQVFPINPEDIVFDS